MKIKRIIIQIVLYLALAGWMMGQETVTLTGIVKEKSSGLPVPFATIRLNQLKEVQGEMFPPISSDLEGLFTYHKVPVGSYRLRVTSVGQKDWVSDLTISATEHYHIGSILMEDTTYHISETVILGQRVVPETVKDKVVYPVTTNMIAASGNTSDMLKYIPGVQVDLKQHIRLDGSDELLLLVDGRERDMSYLKRINPSDISKVEVFRTPPPEFSGAASGVINIVLKEGMKRGFSSRLFSEIPTTKSFVYSFPSAQLDYNNRKIALHLSYTGEINYELINETDSIMFRKAPLPLRISSNEKVRQTNLSHKLNHAIEYKITPRNQIIYEGSWNPYSYEQDGVMKFRVTGREQQAMTSNREEHDKNLNISNSLYYRHHLSDNRSTLSVDLNHGFLRADNKIIYRGLGGDNSFSAINRERAKQHLGYIKADGSFQAAAQTKLNVGFQWQFQSMGDGSTGFSYHEQLYALHGSVAHQFNGSVLQAGMRTEYAEGVLNGDSPKQKIKLLPFFSCQFQMKGTKQITITYRSGIKRPSMFQLNPTRYILNPYAVKMGNPQLKPVSSHSLHTEYSGRFHQNHLSLRLFYDKVNHAIQPLTVLNDENKLLTKPCNLGVLHQFGGQMTAIVKMGCFTIYPSVRLYRQQTRPNSLAVDNGVEERREMVLETELSAILSLAYQTALSASFHYATPTIGMQHRSYCDALYTLSADKRFGKNLKLGLIAALPFAGSFVYQANDTESAQFFSNHSGYLQLPVIPVMLRFTWQIQSGKIDKKMERERLELSRRSKKGF
ncbi:MAG: TonB-dependent receptor [Bacteroidales bacterium]|nr:TonB-dependent receptor [Bacteroidales bacterium]